LFNLKNVYFSLVLFLESGHGYSKSMRNIFGKGFEVLKKRKKKKTVRNYLLIIVTFYKKYI